MKKITREDKLNLKEFLKILYVDKIKITILFLFFFIISFVYVKKNNNFYLTFQVDIECLQILKDIDLLYKTKLCQNYFYKFKQSILSKKKIDLISNNNDQKIFKNITVSNSDGMYILSGSRAGDINKVILEKYLNILNSSILNNILLRVEEEQKKKYDYRLKLEKLLIVDDAQKLRQLLKKEKISINELNLSQSLNTLKLEIAKSEYFDIKNFVNTFKKKPINYIQIKNISKEPLLKIDRNLIFKLLFLSFLISLSLFVIYKFFKIIFLNIKN